jgi:hypothetical protein
MFWSARARVESTTTRACCGHAAVARWSWGGGSSKIWNHAAIGNNESSSDAPDCDRDTVLFGSGDKMIEDSTLSDPRGTFNDDAAADSSAEPTY